MWAIDPQHVLFHDVFVFKFYQALKRKRVKLGITDAIIKGNANVGEIYNMGKAIPLLPPSDMEEGLAIIESILSEMVDSGHVSVSEGNKLSRLLTYIRDYWLPSE